MVTFSLSASVFVVARIWYLWGRRFGELRTLNREPVRDSRGPLLSHMVDKACQNYGPNRATGSLICFATW